MSEINISFSNGAIALTAIVEVIGVIVLGRIFCAITWLRYKNATQSAKLSL
ncbi:hypothetical protein [Myxosarcina sp. GI1]|uniref:hypothetical protein n=1 Tax=Myxosarcina sp. GI1 TaxID=1541065 RepID=UPI0012E0B495|nr:hypothetical protein [Myxosarcina sp. GI1]